MPPKTQPSTQLLFTDPNREPIRAVDQVTFHRSRTAHIDITCCAHVPAAVSETEWSLDRIVTARLRMDLAMAKALATGLAQQIAMLESAESTKN
jgi:hypothetical protein